MPPTPAPPTPHIPYRNDGPFESDTHSTQLAGNGVPVPNWAQAALTPTDVSPVSPPTLNAVGTVRYSPKVEFQYCNDMYVEALSSTSKLLPPPGPPRVISKSSGRPRGLYWNPFAT